MSKTTWKCRLALCSLVCACLASVGAEDEAGDLSAANFKHRLLPVLIARDMARDASDRYPGEFGMPILNGADAIRPELDELEEPLPNPRWPKPMARDAIYFGGTDHGRYIPESLTLNDGVRPDVLVITQNALVDERYEGMLRHRLSGKCWVPAQEDTARAFETYVAEVQSGKRRAGGTLKFENGRVRVAGALAVMQINEILSKDIFDHNKDEHSIYVEEGYVIPWMYDYLSPHGFMMKLNAEKADGLRPDACREDGEFWDWQTRRLLDDPQFCRRRAERCRLVKNPNGGNEEEDCRHRVACRAFSKLRCALAGLYARKGRMKEAQAAFREAYAIDPQFPETTFRYIKESLAGSDKWNAIFDLIEFTVRIDPENKRHGERAGHYREPVRAARDAKTTMNALRRRYGIRDENHWGRDVFSPETLRAFSSDDLDRLADACFDSFDANLLLGGIERAKLSAVWLQGNPAHTNTFARAWRSVKAFKRLRQFHSCQDDSVRNEAANVLAALTFPEANTFDVQNEAAIALAQAERKGECIEAIGKAMKFPESRDFATLVQYAKILERFGEKREAMKAIDLALPLAQNAQPASAVDAANLMLRSGETSKADVRKVLRPLLLRSNVSWTAETLVDFALVCYAAGMPLVAQAVYEKARRMNPVLVDAQLRQNPKLREIEGLLRQRRQP